MDPQAEAIIRELNLAPLPVEGGMFRSTWHSAQTLGSRPAGNAIYFLLAGEMFSHFHRLCSDEIWHHYAGGPVELWLLHPDGSGEMLALGSDFAAGQAPQRVAPAGSWMGARPAPGTAWALMGTTMSPGYVDEDYTHAQPEELLASHPAFAEVIAALTGPPRYE